MHIFLYMQKKVRNSPIPISNSLTNYDLQLVSKIIEQHREGRWLVQQTSQGQLFPKSETPL